WLNKKLEFDPDRPENPEKPLTATGVQKKFVKSVLEALNVNRGGWPPEGKPNPHQPTWVAPWKEFLTARGRDPGKPANTRSWAEVTGIAKKETGRWLVLLVYPVEKVPVLARPSILDAGWSGRHFPSPPCARRGVGGHPVDIGQNYRLGRPI